MSINIKTSSGLQKLTPEVNKSTISSALGYTPTDDTKLNEHASNRDIHVTASDKTKWDNSGDFNNLSNKPNIIDDDSGIFNITDSTGNIALQVASNGITRVAALEINNKDFATAVNDEVIIPELPEWTQDIQDDGQGTYAIVDEQGRKALEISSEGITNLAKLQIKGEDLETIIDKKINDIPEVIIPEEEDPTVEDWAKKENSTLIPNDKLSIAEWAKKEEQPSYSVDAISGAVPSSRKVNGKELASDINLALSDLNEAPDIVETDDGSFVIANENGTKAFEIAPDGTTSVAALTVDGKTLESIIDDKINEIPDVVIPEEVDPYVEEWADTRHSETLIPEDKLPYKVEDWAKKENSTLIPKDKLLIADWAKEPDKPSYSVDEVSNAVPSSRTINGKDLSADISLMLSDLNEAPDIVETDDGYFTIVDEDRNKVLEIDNLGNINVASLNVVDSNKNEIFKVSVDNGITKVKALEVNQKGLEDIIDEKIAAIPEVEIPEVEMPTDTISKITHFEMWGGEVSLESKSDGIIYSDTGYFSLEDGNDYDFTIAQRIPLAPGNNITFTPVENDPDTLQINAPTKLSELEPDDNNQRVSVADKEKWNAVTSKASATALQGHIDGTNNPHKVTAEQVGLGDIRVDNTDKTFTIVDDTAEQHKAFEIASDGTVSIARLNVGGTDINEQLNTLSSQFGDYQPKGSYLTTSTASNTYLARAGGTMAGAIAMNGNNISGAGTITAATFQASSDARLKENLQPLQPHASILSLPTYEFDFIDGPKDQIGCLAQDLAHIHPKLVTVNENGYLTINETKLVYLLLEEMKKLQLKVVDLESQLSLLK